MRYFEIFLFKAIFVRVNISFCLGAFCCVSILLVQPGTAQADKFSHKTVSYNTASTLPMNMGSIKGNHYVVYDGNKSVSAEWSTKTMIMQGTRHTLNLVRDGIVHNVDLDKQTCTKTDVSSVHDQVADPEQLGEQLKKTMNLERAGKCEGAGLKGVLFKSSFGSVCLYKDVFMLWTEAMGSRTEVSDVVFDKRLPKKKISLPKGVKCVAGLSLEDMTNMRERMTESASDSASMTGAVDKSEREDQSQADSEDGQRDEPSLSEEQAKQKVQEATEAAKKLLEGFGGFLKK